MRVLQVLKVLNYLIILCSGLVLTHTIESFAVDKPIQVIAAENMYGNIAQQLGGKNVNVVSILNNPDQDPHLFELTPNTGNIISNANIIIKNGLGYDSWIDHLLKNRLNNSKSHVVSMQTLLKENEGQNPHLWYGINNIEILANVLTNLYTKLQPENKVFFQKNNEKLISQLQDMKKRIDKIKIHSSNIPVAATEPVFGIMAQSLGFIMKEEPYQWTIMNGGEPTAQQIAQFQNDLKTHSIKILFFNNQVVTPEVEQLKKIAEQANITVIGISELMPNNQNYQQWMDHLLDKIENSVKHISR